MSGTAIVHASPNEASYASPALPPTMAGTPVRQKRTQRSSVEEIFSADGFEEEDLRAGGPNLCEPPCYSLHVPNNHHLYHALHVEDEHRNAIRALADQRNIAISDLSFVIREPHCNRSENTTPVLTVILTSRRRNPADRGWADFARRVWHYLDSRGMGEVSVEIVDERFSTRPYIFPCKPSDGIFPIWSEVCGEILARVGLTDTLSVGCHRMGNVQASDSCMPHILVAVMPESRRDWNKVRDEIVNILMKFQLHTVGVIIRKDISQVHEESRFTKSLLTGRCISKAHVGSSIGPHGSSHDQEFALTCYHCVVPNESDVTSHSADDDKTFSDWNRNGVCINDNNASRLLRVDSPTRRDVQEGIRSLDNLILGINTDSYQRVNGAIEEGEYVTGPEKALWAVHSKQIRGFNSEKERMQEYLDKGGHRLGTVFAASGFKEETVSRATPNVNSYHTVRDWALVRPVEGRSFGSNDFIKMSGLLGIEKMEFFPRGATLESGTRLYKMGQRTGETEGQYNGLAEARVDSGFVGGQWRERIMWTHAVVSNDCKEVFSMRGDSGAFVYTTSGFVVGICIGSPKHGNVGYFCHIHDILDDIEEITGAKDIRLKQ